MPGNISVLRDPKAVLYALHYEERGFEFSNGSVYTVCDVGGATVVSPVMRIPAAG